MRKLAIVLLGSLLLLFAASTSALPPNNDTSVAPAGTAIAHDTAYIESGELLMFVNNTGSFGYDRTAYLGVYDGLHYPGECPSTVLYAGGLWIGATVNGQVRVAAAEYAVDYGPGTISGGEPSPDNQTFHVYRIRSGDSKLSNPDYADWPFDQGAPALKNSLGADSIDEFGDRIPLLLADNAAWCVFNDGDMTLHETDPGSGSNAPLNVEVQLYAYAFDSAGPAGRIIFLEYTIVHEGSEFADSMFVSLWADPDVGNPGDDLVGCDTTVDLGYCYNAFGRDAEYGEFPPSVGIMLLSGPTVPSTGDRAWVPGRQAPITGYRNLPMTAFSRYVNGTDPGNCIESWNYMRGRRRDGTEHVDQYTGLATPFVLSGNPLTGSGWIDNSASDKRFMVSAGPFAMNPGDTQFVSVAVLVGSTHSQDCFLDIFADTVYADHVEGISAGRAFALVAEPEHTTGHDYSITFAGPQDRIRWSVHDLTLGSTLLTDQANTRGIADSFEVVDGLVFKPIGPSPGIGSWSVPHGERHFTWVEGEAFELEGFNGAMGWDSPCHMLGVCENRPVPLNRLRRVLIKHAYRGQGMCAFDPTEPNVSYAYRYVQNSNLPPSYDLFERYIPNRQEDFAYQGFIRSVPLSAWDIDSNPPRRLAVGHLENNHENGAVDAKYCPPDYRSHENTSESSQREWLFIFDAEYSESPDSDLAVGLLTEDLPIMYTITATSRSAATWEVGDEFLIEPTGLDSVFSELDVFTLTSPDPRPAGVLASVESIKGQLASLAELRTLAAVAQEKYEEINWTCACPCLADPACAGGGESVVNVLDIVGFIDVAFRGMPLVNDRPCPTERTDVNCDHVTDVRDVVTAIDVAFRDADPAFRFCNPCNQS